MQQLRVTITHRNPARVAGVEHAPLEHVTGETNGAPSADGIQPVYVAEVTGEYDCFQVADH